MRPSIFTASSARLITRRGGRSCAKPSGFQASSSHRLRVTLTTRVTLVSRWRPPSDEAKLTSLDQTELDYREFRGVSCERIFQRGDRVVARESCGTF